MAGQTDQVSSDVPAEGPQTVSEVDKEKARKWFNQARVVGETRNYDYAIECYIGGLELWPDALKEGHMPLRAIGMARRQAKGKPAGLRQSLKRKTTGKNPLQNMLNAEFLLAMDPFNQNHMEQMFVNASKADVLPAAKWIGDIYFDALLSEKKVGAARLSKVSGVFEELGDKLERSGDPVGAVNAYEKALKALGIARNMKPDSAEYFNRMTDLSGKLTISRGKYNQDGTSFHDSMQDREKQAELHDRDRLVQAGDRLSQLIDRARKDYEANPDVASKLTVLVDQLLKRETEADDVEAVKLLTENYERTRNYQFKMRADDVRMSHYRRQARVLRERLRSDPEDASLKAKAQKLADKARQFELGCFKERVANYPTDHRIRFRYAECLFGAGQYEEALPEFQMARIDPKNRAACNLYIGRCFFQNKHFGPAVDVLKQLQAGLESLGDDLSKEVTYWLGRSYEGAGKTGEALESYNQIIQWDYNYMDVRKRIEQLRE